MFDLQGAAGVPRNGRAHGMRDMPQEGTEQDPVRQRPLCVQRLPHPGAGHYHRAVYGRDLEGPR